VVCPVNALPTYLNSEVVRVTQVAGDVLTVTRVQESSTRQTIAAGNSLYLAITNKVFIDLETAINSIDSASSALIAAVAQFVSVANSKATMLLPTKFNAAVDLASTLGNSSGTLTITGLRVSGVNTDTAAHNIALIAEDAGTATHNSTTWYYPGGNIALTAGAAGYAQSGGTVSLHAGSNYLSLSDTAINFSSGNVRFKAGKGFQWYNTTTALWHTKLCTDSPPRDSWDNGEA
jgi:hypothetical protein